MKIGFDVRYLWVCLLLVTLSFSALAQQSADYKVNEVFIIGNKKTKPSIIQRELGINMHDVLDSANILAALDSAQIRIYNTNLFNSVELQPLYTDNNTLYIRS